MIGISDSYKSDRSGVSIFGCNRFKLTFLVNRLLSSVYFASYSLNLYSTAQCDKGICLLFGQTF